MFMYLPDLLRTPLGSKGAYTSLSCDLWPCNQPGLRTPEAGAHGATQAAGQEEALRLKGC